MKKGAFILLFITIISHSFGQSLFFDRADAFFKTYTKEGRVNYNELRKNPVQLDWLTNHLATQTVPQSTGKAYLINAYNILVIHKLVKHPNLVDNPLAIPNFFDAKTVTLAGEQISLNQLENDLIRAVYNDPSVHFVLVCGGLGCPPIANFAYLPQKLEQQLEQQTTIALNDTNFVSENEKTIQLSKIFEWYQTDFGGSQKEVIAYINTYRETPFNSKNKIRYYPYDWSINAGDFPITTLPELSEIEDTPLPIETNLNTPTEKTNLQTFTAGSLLPKGNFDLTLFNTLYTERQKNWQGQSFSNYRSTFVNHLFQITYGITKSKRINLGVDLNFGSSGEARFTDDFKTISRAFAYKNNDSSRVGLTMAGLRVKIQPFSGITNFTLQSTLSVPTIKNAEGFFDNDNPSNNRFWATWDRITWWNQFFFDRTFGKFQLFTEVDFLFRFKKYDNQIGMLDLPLNVFFSYFPTSRLTLYGMTQHVARFTNNINGHDEIVTDWVIPMNYTASGIGLKYQLLYNLNLEVLYTNFWRGKNTGLGNTFNIGLKFLTR